MKKLSMTIIACLLAVMFAVMSPLAVLAKSAENTNDNGKYVSEVKIGMGKTAAEAAASLAGYTILSNKSGNIDLNQNAGGGWGSKGEKVVYLGYKTTDDKDDAITDLAVMNMKGGYSVQEYDALLDMYVREQINPLLDRLISAIQEYRLNYNSQNDNNRLRARYIHDVLNKFIDDDTGKGLGDLFLNRTKYEIGDEAYEALSDTQKRNTADITTIFAQSNGSVILMTENLLARAADTSDDTWLDRFIATTYEDMLDELCDESDILPSDAENKLARMYDDDARKVRSMWTPFSQRLSGYDDARELAENYDTDAVEEELEEVNAFIESVEPGNCNDEETDKLAIYTARQTVLLSELTEAAEAVKTVAVYDYLSNIEYNGMTLTDFFMRPSDEVDITELYPIAASFSAGQMAGLDFVSLLELITIAMTDGESYRDAETDKILETSIYDGVDREIYRKGGVALTSETLRDKAAASASSPDDSFLSSSTIAMMCATGVSFLATCASLYAWADYMPKVFMEKLPVFQRTLESDLAAASTVAQKIRTDILVRASREGLANNGATTWITQENGVKINKLVDTLNKAKNSPEYMNAESVQAEKIAEARNKWQNSIDDMAAQDRMCRNLSIGFAVVTVVLIGITTYLTYRDLVAYYEVEFTPIPHYMVDEKDITAFNAKGEKIFIKNQTAYYKAVECNRTSSDEMFGMLGVCSDLNGDVGQQWLALYSVKNEAMAPILADSLTAVIGKADIPANYTTGIHMFGSDTAYDLNNHMFVWNGEAPCVYVYFNVDDTVKRSAVGSIISDGETALAGGIGIIIGALAMFAVMSLGRKKKEETQA